MALFGSYTDQQLRDAWELVKPAPNWKMPIDANVPSATDLSAVSAAVAYFTGGVPKFTPKFTGMEITSYQVTAPGYYQCIGA